MIRVVDSDFVKKFNFVYITIIWKLDYQTIILSNYEAKS